MPGGRSREGFSVGGGLVAGLAENVADRLSRLEPVGPGRGARASVGKTAPARKRAGAKQATSNKDETPMAPRRSSTKKTTKAKTAAASARSKAAAKKPAAKAAAKKPARKAAPKQNGGGAAGAPQGAGQTVFTEPTPGGKKKTVAEMLGEITWLMTQSTRHKSFFLSDLEWMAMAPIMLNQFRVFYATDTEAEKATGKPTSRPIGVALWALVNEDVGARLASGNSRMRPQDWKCGDRLWVADIIAPYGGQEEMLQDLKSQVFPDRTIKYLGMVDGKPAVREV